MIDVLHLADREPWRQDALCQQVGDPDRWFPDDGGPGSNDAAKAVCRRCTVRASCLQFAIDNREKWGIFGGLSEHERRPLLPPLPLECDHCGRKFANKLARASHMRHRHKDAA